PNCDDRNECTADSCDGFGGCLHTPVADGTACNDGNAGTTNDVCQQGTCAGTSACTTASLTTLHSFSDSDGAYPYAGLVQGSDGNFYGTTQGGGTSGVGTVFQITPTGTLTTLYNFSGGDGAGPYAGLVQGSDGNFYGTTQ